MGNRNFSQNQMTLERDTVRLFAQILVGASGAVTNAQGGGIASITKESTAGQYSIVLQDKYSRLLAMNAIVLDSSASAVATIQTLETAATAQTAVTTKVALTIQCLDFAGAAVNPASGATVMIELVLRNTSVGPFDE